MSDWISVEDALPPETKPYLVNSDMFGVYISLFSNIGNWIYDDDDYDNFVTHWMPLPEPPQ